MSMRCELGELECNDDGIGGRDADGVVGVCESLRRGAVKKVLEVLDGNRVQIRDDASGHGRLQGRPLERQRQQLNTCIADVERPSSKRSGRGWAADREGFTTPSFFPRREIAVTSV